MKKSNRLEDFSFNCLDFVHRYTSKNSGRTFAIAGGLLAGVAFGSWKAADSGISSITSKEKQVVVTQIAPDSYETLFDTDVLESNRRIVEYHQIKDGELNEKSEKAITLDHDNMTINDTVSVKTYYRLFNKPFTQRMALKLD